VLTGRQKSAEKGLVMSQAAPLVLVRMARQVAELSRRAWVALSIRQGWVVCWQVRVLAVQMQEHRAARPAWAHQAHRVHHREMQQVMAEGQQTVPLDSRQSCLSRSMACLPASAQRREQALVQQQE
jgi:hypothetical protein